MVDSLNATLESRSPSQDTALMVTFSAMLLQVYTSLTDRAPEQALLQSSVGTLDLLDSAAKHYIPGDVNNLGPLFQGTCHELYWHENC